MASISVASTSHAPMPGDVLRAMLAAVKSECVLHELTLRDTKSPPEEVSKRIEAILGHLGASCKVLACTAVVHELLKKGCPEILVGEIFDKKSQTVKEVTRVFNIVIPSNSEEASDAPCDGISEEASDAPCDGIFDGFRIPVADQEGFTSLFTYNCHATYNVPASRSRFLPPHFDFFYPLDHLYLALLKGGPSIEFSCALTYSYTNNDGVSHHLNIDVPLVASKRISPNGLELDVQIPGTFFPIQEVLNMATDGADTITCGSTTCFRLPADRFEKYFDSSVINGLSWLQSQSLKPYWSDFPSSQDTSENRTEERIEMYEQILYGKEDPIQDCSRSSEESDDSAFGSSPPRHDMFPSRHVVPS